MQTLLFCFANSEQAGRQLDTLVNEYNKLDELLAPGHNRLYNLVLMPFATIDAVDEKLQLFSDSVCLFHFSGHANKTVLELLDSPALGTGIATLLADCPALRLVFLNGCSTREHVNQLRDSGVKAVIIATSAPVNDDMATQFSGWFYQALSRRGGGASTLRVREAWEEAKRRLQLRPDFAGIAIDRGAFRLDQPVSRNQWVISGDDEALDWQLPTGLARSEALRFLRLNNTKNQPDYFDRPDCQRQLRVLLHQTGDCLISGPVDSGKTTLLRELVDRLVEEQIEAESITDRPILYVDLQQIHATDLTDPRTWYALYNERVAQITHPETVLPLFSKITPSQSAATTDDQLLTDWIIQLDKDRVTVVIDNSTAEQWNALESLYAKSRDMLKDSQMIFVKSYQPEEKPDLTVPYLSEAETQEFVRRYPLLNSMGDVFNRTQGNLFYLTQLGQPALEGLRKNYEQSGQPLNGMFQQRVISENFRAVIQQIKDRFGEPDRRNAVTMGLLALASLPYGINKSLCQYYLTDFASLNELVGTGLLRDENRYGEPWIFMPMLTRQGLEPAFRQAAQQSAALFVNEFARRAQPIDEAVNHILSIQGGSGFLLNLVALLVEGIRSGQSNYLALLKPILLQAHKPLFEQGRWDYAYQLWHAALDLLPTQYIEATDWVLYARAAFHSGRHIQTAACLPKILTASPTLLNRIDYLNLRASYLKDQGDRSQEGQIDACYTEALEWLSKARAAVASEATLAEYEERWASLHYNRAIFRWWWQRNRETAIDDLTQAKTSYEALEDTYMLNLIRMEQADMLLDTATTLDLKQAVRTGLLAARSYFARAGLTGDLALCQYRLGRFYKRYASLDGSNPQQHLQTASDYYELAAQGPDRRLRAITQKHQLVIQGVLLRLMEPDKAVARLTEVASQLTVFRQEGDTWSARVERDLWWFLARLSGDPVQQLHYLEQAWAVATQLSLNPVAGTDKGRAVAIFWDICRLHEQQQQRVACQDFLGGSAQDWIERWFTKNVFSPEDFTATLVADIESTANKPDKYYG